MGKNTFTDKKLKSKKSMLTNILIVLFTILCFNCLLFSNVSFVFCKVEDKSSTQPIDSGWDSDYDYDYGGGSSWDSGGSSWDYDDDDWHSSGSSSSSSDGFSGGGSADAKTLVISLAICAVPVLIYIVIRIAIHKNNANNHKTARKQSILNHLPYPMQQQDKNFNKFVYDAYIQIQNAWMNRDLTNVRSLLSDEMFNMYEMQISQMKRYNQINIMKNFKHNFAYVYSKTVINGLETYKVILSVTCKDYVVDEKSNRVIRGNSNDKLTYFYELTFVKNENIGLQNCPNCGAKIEDQNSSNCQYCNAVLHTHSSNYTLTNKKMLYQFKE